MKKSIVLILAAFTVLVCSCGNSEQDKEAEKKKAELSRELNARKQTDKEVAQLNEEYNEIPDAKLLENNGANSPIYKELKQRYKQQLVALKQKIEATGAKFVMVIITPEVGPSISDLTRYGHPYIKATCNELGIEVYDLSAAIAAQKPEVITQVPRDGHWSKKGSEFLAAQLAPIITKHTGHKATATYKDSERPETFGDLAPGTDEVLDGGKDMPYRVVANAQGLRMNTDVTFPKTKQHILFLGGSQIYSPFLDNDFIATSLLQKKFPDVVIMNAGMISGCTDDFLSLWDEKAKYSEPDVVIVQTNGTDITDLFFTNRNHLARSRKPYHPSETEEKYFRERYRK
jgi:Ni/Co efflux regulator RcnB